jgi:hypothetical protein
MTPLSLTYGFPPNHLSEHDMFCIEMRRRDCSDKELAAVRIRA